MGNETMKDGERAAFETWASQYTKFPENYDAIPAWMVWQAARAASPQSGEPVKPQARLVTFDEFVQYGIDHGANIVNGMPWSFIFNGHAVTHETDDLYLIGTPSIPFRRGEVLVATAFDHSRLIQVLQPQAPTERMSDAARECEWTYDDVDYKWDSACGESWVFNDDGPAENNARFCQGCGGKIVIAARKAEIERGEESS